MGALIVIAENKFLAIEFNLLTLALLVVYVSLKNCTMEKMEGVAVHIIERCQV